MGLFDFFKKKSAEETPVVEEQREGVVEIDGVEVEADAQNEEIVLDVEGNKDMNAAVHEVMDEEEIQIDCANEDILYQEDAVEEDEIEIEFVDEEGEELLTAESEEEAEAVLAELTDMAGEILAEKPLADDEVVVALEDGEVFTADNDEDAIAFVEELVEEVAEELNKEEPAEETPAEEVAEEKPAKMGFFAKLKAGLDKTRKNILGGVDGVLGAFTKIDEDLFEELEEALIMADLGVQTTMDIVENLRKRVKREHATDPSLIKGMLIDEITAILEEGAEEEESLPNPSVLLVIGVNGVGKTTTIGKLAHNYKEEGKSVMLAAADTFRAAAIDQLEIWGERNNVPVIKQEENSDPAAVVFDAVHEARKQNADLLICDTAGRLHNKKNLMEELKKIARVIEREYPAAHKEVYLVLDATTGQNALQQAKLFKEVADITG
ncbi:signal recognition particle-docking protein FtsY, partial [Anaerotignum sp.]